MEYESVTRKGKRYILVEESEFKRLVPSAASEAGLPQLPKADRDGTMPAVEFARITIARRLITDRKAAGLSQIDLARAAGVRVETLNRLEKGKHMPGVRTMDKIDKALSKISAKSFKSSKRVG